MGQDFQINENLVSQIALLASGTCCVAFGGLTGPAVAAFGIFAAPVLGIGGWSLAKWMKRLQLKDPTAHKTIKRVQGRINETLTGDEQFASLSQEARGVIDSHLPKLIAEYWPSPKIIAELAGDLNGFPKAIAKHILDEINGAQLGDVPDGFFETGPPREYAKLVITTALNAALDDKDYFVSVQPHAVMQNLKLSGQIQRDVRKLQAELVTIKYCLGEVLGLLRDIRETQLADSEKLNTLYKRIMSPGSNGIDNQIKEGLRQNIAEMLLSERQATQDAVKEIMADPPNPVEATNQLKRAIAEQKEIRKNTVVNEIELLREIVTINYFNDQSESKAALEGILKIKPRDLVAWNDLGNINHFSSFLKDAMAAYVCVKDIAEKDGNEEYLAISNGKIGNVYISKGDIPSGVKSIRAALEIYKKIGNKKGVATQYGNLANAECIRDNPFDGIKFNQRALKIYEQLDEFEGMARVLGNLGICYSKLQDPKKALYYHKKSLNINEILNDEGGIAANYSNMGLEQNADGNNTQARKLIEKALILNKKLSRGGAIASNLACLGSIEKAEGNINASKGYFLEALKLNEKIGSKFGIAINCGNLAGLEYHLGDKGAACSYLKRALHLFKRVGSMTHVRQVQEQMRNYEC